MSVAEIETNNSDSAGSEWMDRSLALRYRALGDEPITSLFSDAVALLDEAARKTLDINFFPVQKEAGLFLARGGIAEMETGEGKTFTATIPLYLHALRGKGAMLATANDYLAKRDAEWMGPVFNALGMTVGAVVHGMSDSQRRDAYNCDITYGTCKEFGFDFLRDRMKKRFVTEQEFWFGGEGANRASPVRSQSLAVRREPNFILVDEADSLLIDDARTPLVISAQPTDAVLREVACYYFAAEVADQFREDEHFVYEHEKRTVDLTESGLDLVRSLPKSVALDGLSLIDLYEFVERAIKVKREYFRDQHFVIQNDKVIIVDDATGRLAHGRRWQGGIHQAVEAMANQKIEIDTGHAAQITVQQLIGLFPLVAGMTGTAWECRREFSKTYKCRVGRIATNLPSQRRQLTGRFYQTSELKWNAIVDEIIEVKNEGRPLLIGTQSIANSELLSSMLATANIEHVVLNARQVEKEAEIVAEAGQPGRVTVATNMAGRGTDIQLGPGISDIGGLHVICCQFHDSSRIDRQLFGRGGRQGDPGTTRQYCSAEDKLLETAFGVERADKIRRAGKTKADQWWFNVFRKAQRLVERLQFKQRHVMQYVQKERSKALTDAGRDPYLESSE